MDPTAAWNTMIDETNDVDERVEVAEALRGWLDSGGFPPDTPETLSATYFEIAKVLRLGAST